jgi:hypothetical protein
VQPDPNLESQLGGEKQLLSAGRPCTGPVITMDSAAL